MRLNHINKIRANISIFSSRKTSNILDGTYKSVYKGKSMNFDNLREYVINDDVKDIDWKSSARSGTLLVKQFIAEKKHNILVVLDTGAKMDADTDKHENKGNLAINIAGTLGYIAVKNGDYIGLSYYKDNKVVFKQFKDDLYNLEEYLCCYEKDYMNNSDGDLNTLLEYIYKNIAKRMIIFIVTDLSGIESISNKTLKSLSNTHDVMAININDNFLVGEDLFDTETNKYVPSFFLNDAKLNEIERDVRNELIKNNNEKFLRGKSHFISISSEKETNLKIIQLLEEHRHANIN